MKRGSGGLRTGGGLLLGREQATRHDGGRLGIGCMKRRRTTVSNWEHNRLIQNGRAAPLAAGVVGPVGAALALALATSLVCVSLVGAASVGSGAKAVCTKTILHLH